ncbi:hypothetical protein BASA81_007748 [Batrachochytrium salamandrivorans]|nr:hypothetical protein BASA81_007748 [Batrachochytrium salamandrivorans]
MRIWLLLLSLVVWTAAAAAGVVVKGEECGEGGEILTYVKRGLTPAPEGALRPSKGDRVTVHCTGYGKNGNLGEKFWSTRDPDQAPFTFQIGMKRVIRCWDEGVMDMGVGEVAEITAHPSYAYGAGGFPHWGILPNSTLRFEIEVLSIQK